MLIAELEYQLDDRIYTQRTLRLRVGVSDIRRQMDRAARKLRDGGEAVPGYRPGRGPLALFLRHFKQRIEAESFEELRRDAVQQVLKQLGDEHQPMLPPEVQERDKVRLNYNRPLEFAVKYFVDPAGISRRPEQPGFEKPQLPGGAVSANRFVPMGIPNGPVLPQAPQPPAGSPALPAAPELGPGMQSASGA